MSEFKVTLEGAWESFREKLGHHVLYCCRRPEDCTTDWRGYRYPWAHVYVLEPDPKNDTDDEISIGGNMIERTSFEDVSPLEMQSVIYAMRAKYGSRTQDDTNTP